MNPRGNEGLHPLMRTLAKLRQDKGIAVVVVARRCQVAPATIWSWERGSRQPNLWQLGRYGELLGVQLWWHATPPAGPNPPTL